jgi:hypothetical protein
MSDSTLGGDEPGQPGSGQGEPDGQPPASGPSGDGPPTVAEPVFGQPGYGQPPGYSDPSPFGPPPESPAQPGYGQPAGQPPGPSACGQQPPGGREWHGQQPPGYGQAGYGQPGYGQPGYGQPPRYTPGYGQGGWNTAGAPQPGGIPLRPLALGDILNGAVTAIRRNPAATVGLSAIVLSITGVVTTAVTLAVAGNLRTTVNSFGNGPVSITTTRNSLGGLGLVFLVTVLLGLIAEVILTGMLTGVVGRGVLGQRVSIGQAWRLARPRLLGIIGVLLLSWLILGAVWIPYVVILVVLAGLHLGGLALAFGIIGGLAMFVLDVVLYIRFTLATPVVVLEQRSPAAALRRSWQLAARSFWRLFGIFLLTAIIVSIAAVILQVPFTVVKSLVGGGFGSVGASTSAAAIIVGGIGGIVAGAITRPVEAGVIVLLYVDMRMRKEGLDLVLRDAAQSQEMTGDEFATLWRPPAPGQATGLAPGPGPGGTPPPASW